MFVVLVGGLLADLSQPSRTTSSNLIIGLFLWDFFAEATKTGMASLAAKGFLLTKARFPRWILVVTSIANALITLLVFAGWSRRIWSQPAAARALAALGAFCLLCRRGAGRDRHRAISLGRACSFCDSAI